MDSRITRNYITPETVEQLEMPYRQKEHLYPLVTILGELVLYRDRVITLKTGSV